MDVETSGPGSGDGGRVRLVDVAARAGVSMKTVSNVIHDFPFVSARTRERVTAAIAELDYRPNLSARNLARGRTGMIALVVPQLDMPYFAALSREVLDVAEQHGWVVLIHQTGGDLAAERSALSGGFGQRIDGMIISPLAAKAADVARRPRPGPLVTLGEHTYLPEVDHVGIDNAAAAELATEHLIGLGRRRIAVVGPGGASTNDRYLGYRRALLAAGLDPRPELVLPAPSNRGEEAEEVVGGLLDSRVAPPDAIFCSTDWLALGALRALRLRGLRVPEDVALVGFDDIPYGRAATPTLTTVAPDRAQIARLAVESLVEQGRGVDHVPRNHPADFALVVRESTAGIQPPPGHSSAST